MSLDVMLEAVAQVMGEEFADMLEASFEDYAWPNPWPHDAPLPDL
jgi:hypothetical protein